MQHPSSNRRPFILQSLILAAIVGAAGCEVESPLAPSIDGLTVQSIAITGTATLERPGDVVQLTATATLAIRWIGREGDRRDLTYADLRGQTSRFANALRRLGVGKGDVVAAVSARVPELYAAALGTLKLGSVFTPLFAAFGPEPSRVIPRT